MRVNGRQDGCIFRNIYPKHIATWTELMSWELLCLGLLCLVSPCFTSFFSRQGDITTTMLYIGGQAGNLLSAPGQLTFSWPVTAGVGRWPPCRSWEISFSRALCVSWLGVLRCGVAVGTKKGWPMIRLRFAQTDGANLARIQYLRDCQGFFHQP